MIFWNHLKNSADLLLPDVLDCGIRPHRCSLWFAYFQKVISSSHDEHGTVRVSFWAWILALLVKMPIHYSFEILQWFVFLDAREDKVTAVQMANVS
mgnify:CR=1 FL=1